MSKKDILEEIAILRDELKNLSGELKAYKHQTQKDIGTHEDNYHIKDKPLFDFYYYDDNRVLHPLSPIRSNCFKLIDIGTVTLDQIEFYKATYQRINSDGTDETDTINKFKKIDQGEDK